MPPVFLILLLIFTNVTSFKSVADFNNQLKKNENVDMSTTDVLVGKAMDFMYSNRTIMNIIAGELWNVGSVAVDKIVKLKDGKHKQTTS